MAKGIEKILEKWVLRVQVAMFLIDFTPLECRGGAFTLLLVLPEAATRKRTVDKIVSEQKAEQAIIFVGSE